MSQVELCGIEKSVQEDSSSPTVGGFFGGFFGGMTGSFSRGRLTHAKTITRRKILRELDLRIEAGEYVVLLGPSGCGKTTTLRMIAGLDRPDQGSVRINGRDVSAVPPRHRDVAMVFQQDALYPHLSIRQSIRCGLEHFPDAQTRLLEAARMVGIDSLLDRLPSQLSGGELRRAAVAKAIARRAAVRLLDEPLSAIDATAVHAIQDHLSHWHADFPGTTLHVTHDGNEAMRLADKIAVMQRGRMLQFASPGVIYDAPASIQVALAVGWPPMNFFAARFSGGCWSLTDQEPPLRIGSDSASGQPSVQIGVRPHAWRVAPAGTSPENHECSLHTKLTRLRRIDHRWMANFAIANVIGSRETVAMLDSVAGLELGREYQLRVHRDHVHAFGADCQRWSASTTMPGWKL